MASAFAPCPHPNLGSLAFLTSSPTEHTSRHTGMATCVDWRVCLRYQPLITSAICPRQAVPCYHLRSKIFNRGELSQPELTFSSVRSSPCDGGGTADSSKVPLLHPGTGMEGQSL